MDREDIIGETFHDQVDGGGIRHNEGKPPVELVPPELVLAAARALGKGAKKYEPGNWERGMSWMKVYACLLRHMFAWVSGKDRDDESGLSHLDHAASNLAMLVAYEARKQHKEYDDRSIEWSHMS